VICSELRRSLLHAVHFVSIICSAYHGCTTKIIILEVYGSGLLHSCALNDLLALSPVFVIMYMQSHVSIT
jgi:hypothetical protein